MYKLNTLEFNKVSRSQYGRGTDFKQDIVEHRGSNCYILTSGNSFTKCVKYVTGKDYLHEFLTFSTDEQRRSYVMTFARVQPLSEKYNNNKGWYDGFRVCPRDTTEKNIALDMSKNHFCLVTEELKLNFKVVDNIISGKHIKSFIKYEIKPEKSSTSII